MTSLGVALRGIRYRPGRSLIVLLLAAVATAATVIAPAYSRAAQQSVLTDRLRGAPVGATTLLVRSDPSEAGAPVVESTSEAKLELRLLFGRRPRLTEHLEPPVGGADVTTIATPEGAGPVTARLSYRDDVCNHVTITAGTCVGDSGTVMLSARSAGEHGITVGSRIGFRGARQDREEPREYTVAGLYEPRDVADPYWGVGSYFAAAPAQGDSPATVDAAFVADEEDVTLPGAPPTVHLSYPVRVDALRLDAVEAVRSDLAGLTTDVNAAELRLVTSLPGLLSDVDGEVSALGRTVPVVAVPLVIVSWFILVLLVAALTDERSPEVALAKLRGYSPGRAARFGRAEALILVLIAAPVGLLAGLVAVEAAARTLLGQGVHVELRWPLALAAGLAVAAGLLAVRVGSGRILGRPVLALLRRVPERSRWRAGLAETGIVALAAASLVAALSDQTAPLAMLAPALLAVVAGILTARMLGLWSRVRVRRHARRGRVSGLLAHAQLSRRPLGQRIMLVVTVAVAMLSFAATAWDVAAQARRDVATDTIGADRVISVGAAHPEALVAAVEATAPDTAMPVVRVTEPYAGSTVELVGVRSDRLADVAVWRGHDHGQLADLGARLRPAGVAPLPVDDFVEVTASAGGLAGDPHLAAVVVPRGEPARTVDLGALARGSNRYRAPLPICSSGCRLLGLAVTRTGSRNSTLAAVVSVERLTTGSGQLPAGFDADGRWRARESGARVRVQAGTALRIEVDSAGTGDAVVEYMDTPTALPAALAGPSPADDGAAEEFSFPGLGETPQRFAVVRREPTLPRVGSRAVLFDLDYAVRAAQRSSTLSDNTRLRYEVWATAAAPADLASRLAGRGVEILGEESIVAERARLARGAPALGLALYLIAGCAALALAIGAVLLTAYVGAQSRRYELAALRIAGVRPWQLRRGLLREYGHLLGLPVLVGLFTGMAGAALMLPGIPLVTVGTSLGQVTYEPGLGALPVAVAATLAGLVVAVLAVQRLVGRATPDQLREGEAT